MATAKNCDVAVIGAGVFGAWTAYQLQQSGARVILLDAYGPGNSRASSGGESRIIRMGYGPDEIYTRSAQRSLAAWQHLFSRTDQRLFHRTGVLWLAAEDDPYSTNTISTLERTGVAFEMLRRSEVEERYPQLVFGLTAWAIFEPDSGVLMARQAVRTVLHEAQQNGVKYLGDSVLPPTGKGSLGLVTTVNGRRIEARDFVFACGPWLPKIFPGLLGELIQVTRQEVFFFGATAGDNRFSPPRMPVWIDFKELVYAIPDLENRGFKIAIDAHGTTFDPDTGARFASSEGLAAVRNYLAVRVPALADAPVLESRVCQYENTSNGDFLIDRHPDFENVWLVGGGSGHGFKHGPAVGEYVAGLISGSGVQVEPRFTLGTKQKAHQRKVY
jgi:monomeric sarcosine oxidase